MKSFFFAFFIPLAFHVKATKKKKKGRSEKEKSENCKAKKKSENVQNKVVNQYKCPVVI